MKWKIELWLFAFEFVPSLGRIIFVNVSAGLGEKRNSTCLICLVMLSSTSTHPVPNAQCLTHLTILNFCLEYANP